MALLLDIFDDARQLLSQQWHEQPTPERTVRRARTFLDTLPREYEKRNPPTLDERRRLGYIIDLLKESSSLIDVHSLPQVGPTLPTTKTPDDRFPSAFQIIKRAAQPALLIVLLIWLLVIGKFPILIPFLLLAALTLPFRILFRPSKWRSYLTEYDPRRSSAQDHDEDRDVHAVVQIDVNALLTRLRQTIAKAETLLKEEKQEPPDTPKNPIHEARDILGFFQDLLEASHFQDAEYALKITRSLRRILSRHGIEIEDFDEGKNESHFEFEFDDTSDSHGMTTRFALVTKNGTLLAPGSVLTSSQKK